MGDETPTYSNTTRMKNIYITLLIIASLLALGCILTGEGFIRDKATPCRNDMQCNGTYPQP